MSKTVLLRHLKWFSIFLIDSQNPLFLNSIMPNGLGVGLGLRFTIDCILNHIVKPVCVCVSMTIYYRKHSFGAIKGSVMVYKKQFLIIFK